MIRWFRWSIEPAECIGRAAWCEWCQRGIYDGSEWRDETDGDIGAAGKFELRLEIFPRISLPFSKNALSAPDLGFLIMTLERLLIISLFFPKYVLFWKIQDTIGRSTTGRSTMTLYPGTMLLMPCPGMLLFMLWPCFVFFFLQNFLRL